MKATIGIVLVSLDIAVNQGTNTRHPDAYDRDRSEEQIMRTVRRFVNDESGMTMALAIMMIVLIGVMGAGLLTFVSRDLNTVVEENRGQRAFEVADAGIGAAKRQLSSDCSATPPGAMPITITLIWR